MEPAAEAKKVPLKSAAPAKPKSCQNCGFKNDADYTNCVKCGEENPVKAAEAAKKPAPEPEVKKAKPKVVEENPKDELLKGMTFKTKAKGVAESSNIKVGDLVPGMRVWATIGGEEGWAPAEVLRVKNDSIRVRHEDDASEHDYPPAKLFIRNPPNLDNVSDLTQLSYMHEPGLLYILAERYSNSQIYTFTGTTLIAVNPYARLPLYGKEILDSYVGQPIGRMPPHVFAVAEDAFRSMMDFSEPQSVLVSGESGAGKTETTKVLLQYLAAMGSLSDGAAGDESNAKNSKKGASGGGGGKTSVEQQVLQSNPILEAFGNAKTLRNDNSSRFGKFIRIQFDARGHIEGAKVQTYLLEKPRLTSQIPGERNFHVFYQLCKGASSVDRKQLALKEVSDYHYLNQGNCPDVPNVDDVHEFEVLRDALKIFGIGLEEQKSLWRYLSGILQLGNITFKPEDEGKDEAILDQGKPLAYAAKLLGLKQDDIKKSLLRRQVTVGKSVITIRLKVSEAETARDAFAMLLYGKLFEHLVSLINKGLAGTGIDEESKRFIGVLDIYGFEFFEKNSFEQFCINWANEKLQQQFNQHIFKLEQAEYVREKIDWAYIEFADNQPILSLIEDKNPLGIIPILDEQCRFPKNDHLTFGEKLFQDFKDNPYFEKPKFSKTAFTIDHYAGKVTYDTLLFLDKNRDYLIPEQFIILGDSEEEFVKQLFAQAAAEFKESGGSMKLTSVGSAFKSSLAELMSVINRTQTHYIRCIKPNDKKKPKVFQKSMSLHQLRCGGVLETVRIAAAGFPTRWPFEKFCSRYRILAPLIFDEHKDNWKECAAALIKKIGLEANQFQLGLTKVFLRAGLVALFEELLKRKLDEAAIVIQKHVRSLVKRKQFLRMKRNSVAIQCRIRRFLARQLLEENKRKWMATVLQAYVRAVIHRRKFLRMRKAALLVQRRYRRFKMAAALKTLLKQSKQLKRRREREVKMVTRLQAVIRMKLQRRKFLVMRAQSRDVMGKFQKVMDEKSQLETKVEELTWRLTAEHRAKTRLQEQVAELEEKLKKSLEDSEAMQKELQAQRKLGEETREAVAQMSAKNDELEKMLEKAKGDVRSKDQQIEKFKVDLEQAKTNKVNEDQMNEQTSRIRELEAEVKRVTMALEEEKMRAKEITESVMSLKAQEVDKLQSKIQEAFGFVPSESYFGLAEETNSPAVHSSRQQMEALARMTQKKTKDEGVLALIDFLLSVREGFSNGDCPTLGFILIHVFNHWDCLRKDRYDMFEHVIQGLVVDIPAITASNSGLSYVLNSMLFLLHAFEDQLRSGGMEDPWAVKQVHVDEMQEFSDLKEDQLMPATIHFLHKLRGVVASMYMELVLNIEEDLDPLLRVALGHVVSGNYKGAKSAFQNVVRELGSIVALVMKDFWPPAVLVCLVKQIFYFINAFVMNGVLAQKQLCCQEAGAVLMTWIQELTTWVGSNKHLGVTECLDELKCLKQVVEFLVSDKSQLGKLSEASRKQFPDLLVSQMKQLLTNYVPGKDEEPIAARVTRALTKNREDGDLLLDKTMLYPLNTERLHDISFSQLVVLPFPSQVGKMLAEKMASSEFLDDEYCFVHFDLDVFDIGDEMDDVELEDESVIFENEEFQELDEETRKRLMLAYDDLDKSKSSTLRLKFSRDSGAPAAAAAAAAAPPASSDSPVDLIREKVQARLEAKKREKEETKKQEEDPLMFSWQVGDICEAVFLDDGMWYAAEIIDGPNDEGFYNVLFTDYGNEQWTDPELLRISPDMLDLLAPDGNNDDGLTMDSAIFSDEMSMIQTLEDPFK